MLVAQWGFAYSNFWFHCSSRVVGSSINRASSYRLIHPRLTICSSVNWVGRLTVPERQSDHARTLDYTLDQDKYFNGNSFFPRTPYMGFLCNVKQPLGAHQLYLLVTICYTCHLPHSRRGYIMPCAKGRWMVVWRKVRVGPVNLVILLKHLKYLDNL